MACTGFNHPLRCLLRETSSTKEVASFLVPTLSRCQTRRPFSTSPSHHSRIGMAPISIPSEVNLKFLPIPRSGVQNRNVDAPATALDITGPQGQMTVNLPAYVFTKYDEAARKITVSVGDQTIKHQKAMWGTMRAAIQNAVSGVSEGHICILRMVGVGYRATIEDTAITKEPEYEGQKFISLKLGYAHPVELGVPQGVKATVPQPTRILLEGPDKQVITQFAADIRKWRKPEPYKGKGIFVNDETIKLKAKKIK